MVQRSLSHERDGRMQFSLHPSDMMVRYIPLEATFLEVARKKTYSIPCKINGRSLKEWQGKREQLETFHCYKGFEVDCIRSPENVVPKRAQQNGQRKSWSIQLNLREEIRVRDLRWTQSL